MKLGFSVFFLKIQMASRSSKLLSPFPIILCPHNLLNPVMFSGQRSNTTERESFLWKGCSQVCHLSFFILLPLNIPNSALLCLGMKSSFMMQLRVHLLVVRLKLLHKTLLGSALWRGSLPKSAPPAPAQGRDPQPVTVTGRTLQRCLSVMSRSLATQRCFCRSQIQRKFSENKDTFLSVFLSWGLLNSLFKVMSVDVKFSVRRDRDTCHWRQNVVYST